MLDGIDEHFQIELLEGEQIYACNICDEGFDIENEIIAVNHKYILIEINKKKLTRKKMTAAVRNQ